MSRLPLALPALALLLTVAPAAPVPKEKPKVYFPTAVGTKWVYLFSNTAAGRTSTREVTSVVTAADRKDGATVVSIDSEKDGKVVPAQAVSVSAEAVFRLRFGDRAAFDPPVCLLKLPHKPGQTWEVDSTFANRRIKGAMAAHAAEPVEVPAGKFSAVRVDFEFTDDGDPRTARFWYALGVGLVKQEDKTSAMELKLELKQFTPGKD